jgi:uncharacterized protein
MRIVVSGATGFVGSALVAFLAKAEHDVVRLVRSRTRESDAQWNPDRGEIEAQKLGGCEAVMHLAGENISAGRWTAAKKERLLTSRVKGTRLLAETVAAMTRPPRVFVSSSAVGFYGDRGSEWVREDSPSGSGFLAEVCRQWEAATRPAEQKGIRVVRLRTGVVLARHGGMLGKIALPFKLGVGGKVGSGNQYLSWISLTDLCRVVLFAIENPDLQGAVNAVAPNPVTNLEFTKTLGRVLSRPTIFPLPAFVARLALGEMADELLLASTRVEPAKLQAAAFKFTHPTLAPALRA